MRLLIPTKARLFKTAKEFENFDKRIADLESRFGEVGKTGWEVRLRLSVFAS